jgi:F0F1-type ATP synthase membrane subunit c/vacuolar-type H+-ATPase subunit K
MKHLVILLILCITTYFAWRGSDARTKREIKKFIGRHVLAMVLIFGVAFLGLVAAFYSNSVNIL